MKNKALYIGIGVVALGGLIYFMMRKKGADATASDEMETKSTEETPSAATTPSVVPLASKGSGITRPQPLAPTCGCGTGQIPCPNQRCASKTSLTNKLAPTMPRRQGSSTSYTSVPKADPETEKFAFTLNF